MKTLKDHLILFQAECLMCQLYTKAFVGSGILDHDGRAAYQQYPAQACPALDLDRAVNKIALINRQTGQVTYGIESLFKVCAIAVPFLKPLFLFKPFVWLMSKLYEFISYNRRVIIPAPVLGQSLQMQPGFKKQQRVAYLVFTWFVTSCIRSSYSKLMYGFLPAAYFSREFIVCGGQILFQALVLTLYKKAKLWDYLGNLMTISFAGALLLFPVLILSSFLGLAPIFYFMWFLVVVSLMFLEHIRRTRLLNLGSVMTFSWALYPLFVPLIIL